MAASALPAPSQEYRALLLFADLPAGCIAHPVTDHHLAPHLRPGEFAIIDSADREPVNGELFLVAWMGRPGPDGKEDGALCQVYRRDGSWLVGSLRRHRSRAKVERMIREGRYDALGWSNGPYCDGALERQIRGRVVGILAPAFEEPRLSSITRGGAGS